MIFDFMFRFLFSPRSGAVIRRIAWLTWGGLTVSVAALIIVLSVMRALNLRIEDRTLAAEPHLWVQVPGLQGLALETHPVVEKIRCHSDWKYYFEETQDVILRTMDGRFQGAVARGVSDAGYKTLISKIDKVVPHRSSDGSDSSILGEGDIDVGSDLAHSLGVFEGDSIMVIPPESLLLPVGESPPFEKVRVRKILSTNLADVDSKNIFYNQAKTLRTLSKATSRNPSIVVWTPQPRNAPEDQDDLQKLSGVQVQTWMQRNSALFFALRMEKLVIGFFLSIASLVAGFSLLSVLGLLISQKRKDWGLLQAVGMGPVALQKLIVGIGVSLGGLGIFSGALLGTGVSLYLQYYPLRVLPDIYYDSEITARLDFSFVVNLVIVGIGLSYLGASRVGRTLYRLSPSELLRNQART